MTLNELIRELRDVTDGDADAGAMPVVTHFCGDSMAPVDGVLAEICVIMRKGRVAEIRLDWTVE